MQFRQNIISTFEILAEISKKRNDKEFPHLVSSIITHHKNHFITYKNIVYGINTARVMHKGCCYGEHAEMNAIKKLPRNKSSRIILIDFYINRSNKTGNNKMAMPCQNCIKHMQRLLLWGYLVKDVYFPIENNIVKKLKFNDLLNSEDKYISSRFRRPKYSKVIK